MKDYKYDYKRTNFKIENIADNKAYYIKIDNEYVEVDEKVYKTCKASYDKIRYTYKNEVVKSVMYYENIDLATFYIFNDSRNSIINQIYIKDLANLIIKEINLLPQQDKEIAKLSFVDELSNSEISRILNIPRTTITYRKKIIQHNLQKKNEKILSHRITIFICMCERHIHLRRYS